jgi:hypothetical protein
MSDGPEGLDDTDPAPEELARPPRRLQDFISAMKGRMPQAAADAPGVPSPGPSSSDQVLAAPISEEARSRAAERIAGLGSLAGLADKTAARTKQVTQSAVAASKTGFAKAARISRESVLPELSRTGATIREHARPERLAQHYREFLLWLHANVLDSGIERLFFRPTKGHVPLAGLTVRGDNRAAGHDYRPTPYVVFKLALSAIDKEDIPKLSFVDYGAGKGRVMLLAAQHPFTAVGGIEFAEELHDDATMNIAQFPRSRMKCRNVECALDDAVAIAPLEGEVVHYFFNPFGPEIFAEVLKGIVRSYHAKPRRLYVILIDMDEGDRLHKTGVFQELKLPQAEQAQASLLSPYKIGVYRSLA